MFLSTKTTEHHRWLLLRLYALRFESDYIQELQQIIWIRLILFGSLIGIGFLRLAL